MKILELIRPAYLEVRRIGNNIRRSIEYSLSAKKKDIKIAISTVLGYSEQTIPKLINDLKKYGFSGNSIYVFEGGHNKIEHSFAGYHYYKIDHNSFDLNGLITINELNLNADYWLLLHDTVTIGKKFKKMVYTCQFKNFLGLKLLKKDVSMNIGFYSMPLIRQNSEYLHSFKNTDYTEKGLLNAKERGAIEEDYIFKNSQNIGYVHYDLQYRVKCENDVMYKGRLRRMEYYPQLDMTKYKANFVTDKEWIIKL
ncbi:MAG: hypothetical protein DI598_04950 [Pseudopedobacter saltans]|uniref:DUF5672 domain-containing protein n=1 Tax=Pseudopedobacter saltans TaxID=151895 RepID=A0A2W5GY48_9SPHI|nr:MAG: hypothetical protein DI598_04950 [Pseudopedobacter saltans]